MYKLYTGRSLKFKWFKSKKEKWDKDGIPPPIPGGEQIPLFGSNSEYLRFNYKKQPTIPTIKL
jgi:hypothetical protein